jgi:hypothetical protein
MMKADEQEADDATTSERRRQQRPMTRHRGPSNQNDHGRNSRTTTTTGISSRSYYARSLSKHGQLLTYVVSTWYTWPGKVLVAAREERQRPDGPTSPRSSRQARTTEPSTTTTRRMVDLWTTRLWFGLIIACVLFHIMAMAVERSAATILAGIMALGLAPVVYVRQQKLQRLDRTCICTHVYSGCCAGAATDARCFFYSLLSLTPCLFLTTKTTTTPIIIINNSTAPSPESVATTSHAVVPRKQSAIVARATIGPTGRPVRAYRS